MGSAGALDLNMVVPGGLIRLQPGLDDGSFQKGLSGHDAVVAGEPFLEKAII